jgi:hypothetical protein
MLHGGVCVVHSSSAGAPIPRFQAPGIMPEGLYLAYGGELVCASFAAHLIYLTKPIEGSVVLQRALSAPCVLLQLLASRMLGVAVTLMHVPPTYASCI